MSEIFSEKLNEKEITKIIVDNWKNSDAIKDMLIAEEYFKVENSEINKKTRVYYDKNKTAYENPAVSNNKIPSGLLRMLVQQKQDYAFAKEFVLKLTSNGNEISINENSEEKKYFDVWNNLVKNSLSKLSYSLSKNAINKGIAWCYIWIDDDGEIQFYEISSENIYPVWDDKQHNNLNKLVNNYSFNFYESITPEIKEYAEYWDDNQHIIYDVTNDYREVPKYFDSEEKPMYTHMINGKKEGVSWEKIPFVCLKGTDDEKPLINFIKKSLDAYDSILSKSADGLEDDLDPTLLIKGISPEVGSLIEARELAKLTKMIAVDVDGDANFLQEKTEIDGNLKLLTVLRHNIISDGYGVDFEDSRFNGNPNQMVIKSLYQNIDTYVDGLERHFQDFIDSLKYFVDKWLEWKNIGTADVYKKYKILVKLDRNMMMNQSAMIEDAVKLANTGISLETQLEFNPVVQDVELEKQRLEEERKEAEKNNQLFNFDDSLDDESNTNKEEE